MFIIIKNFNFNATRYKIINLVFIYIYYIRLCDS